MFWYYIIFHAFHVSRAYNFNLEEMIHRDDHFLGNIDRDVYISDVLPSEAMNKPLLYNKHEMNEAQKRQRAEKKPKLIKENLLNIDDFFDQYAKRLKHKGVEQLIDMGRLIEKKLNLKNNITYDIVSTIIEDFKHKFEDNLNHILLNEGIDEKDSLLPILMQSSNMISFRAKKMLISAISDKYTGKTAVLYNILLKTRKEKSYANKKELEYLCEKIQVCLNYVSFSDNMVDTITEILKYDPREMKELFAELSNQLAKKSDFFRTLINNDTILIIARKMRRLNEDYEGMKLILSVIRSVMKERQKPIKSRNPEVIKRTNAARELLKIIDNAYAYEDDEEMEKMFDLLIKQIGYYRVSFKSGLKNTLGMFIGQMVTVLSENIDRANKKKINEYTKNILHGNLKD